MVMVAKNNCKHEKRRVIVDLGLEMCCECGLVLTDTNMQPVTITIPGHPVPKARPRLGVRGRKAYIYTPRQTLDYEKLVGRVAKSLGCRPVEGQVSVSLHVFCKGRMDVDNVAKSVLDGLAGVAYEDDDQVVELLVRKHKVKRKEEERVEIEIRKVG